MRKFLIFIIVTLLFPCVAIGQAGFIGLYLDTPIYMDCDYIDAGPALVPVYVVHQACPGATASQWMVFHGNGFNCTYVGEIVNMPVSIGSTQTGISLAYGGCQGATNLLLVTINYFCMGASPTCAYIEVVGDTASVSGTVEVIDCSLTLHTNVGGRWMTINPDVTCLCGCPCGSCPTYVSSWGRIKAVYR